MIVAIGEMLVNGQGFGGVGWDTVATSVSHGSSSAFISPVSSDPAGRAMLEEMVDRHVLFDPDLCSSPYPSMSLSRIDGTAPMHVDSERLLSALQVNTDIRVIHLGSVTLQRQEPSEAILCAVERYLPKPVVFVEPFVRRKLIPDKNAAVSSLRHSFRLADVLVLRQEDILLLGQSRKELQDEYGCRVVLDGVWYNTDGSSIVSRPPADDRAYAGTLISVMHEAGLFGQDGADPVFTYDRVVIERALASAAEATYVERDES